MSFVVLAIAVIPAGGGGLCCGGSEQLQGTTCRSSRGRHRAGGANRQPGIRGC